MTRTCQVADCDRQHAARGYCKRHYNKHIDVDRHRKVDIACAYCGTLTQKELSRANRYAALYCSFICRDLAALDKGDPLVTARAAQRTRLPTSTRLPADHPARWYGTSCTVAWSTCDHCTNPVAHNPKVYRRFCSKRCLWAHKHKGRVVRRRSTIFERDNYRCWMCGKQCDRSTQVPHPDAPTVDHLVPRSLGGSNHLDNLGTACFACNSRRGASWDVPAA